MRDPAALGRRHTGGSERHAAAERTGRLIDLRGDAAGEEGRRGEQAEVAALSRSGRQVVAERSGHHIPLQQPELVVSPSATCWRHELGPEPWSPVTETVLAPLAGWESYYVIVGSSAAALTGLQFVVIALINDLHTRSSGDAIGAFGTPTVVHFCVALLTASILSAPWAALGSPAIALGITGLAGLVYAAIVIRRARRQADYKPVLEDWLFHAAFPIAAYGSIVGGAIALVTHTGGALFAIAAATLLLVFIGIHNAWDTVTWITANRNQIGNRAGGAPSADAADAGSASNSASRDAERVETR